LPDATNDLRKKPLAARHFKVSIDKYASGTVSFMLG
jgi:hypothetical protein